ncbi:MULTISPECIES: AraC family transcriptional regulator [unclassified Paenibacillus]|uniref:helix-turn-helix domain-containing protein n=1 Tax=unclassified Paenibacillus TaxID=185978 RepID=UPI001AEB2A95|nr:MULTISPECIES: AraC family transcriptional regulator [unclassified Paenibacillus]MBP1153740.1 AraC-like DNA-binding protein [Paenibacillus sp. PvP091]MBP1170875.1 AraC-like DNA-binding protein [Paenibacillus sp. PvR098]MBP2441903.1 AraC-like DNA-binding protein [Paenibacillus sp. PvP052]
MLYHLPRTSIGLQFVRPMPMLMLKGIGWQSISVHSYIWDGKKRGDEHCLFQYTLSGHGEIEIKGTTYRLEPETAFIVEIPGDHCYRLPPDSSEWEVLYIEFSKEALPFWRQLLTLTSPVMAIPAGSGLIQMAWNTYELAVKDQIHDMYQCSQYAYRFIMELMSYTYQNQKAKPLPSKIELCKQFIDTRYQDPIGLKEMGEAVGLSKFHLTREFEKKLGVTPTRYLTEVRLEHSAKLLVSSMDNLESIAKQVGFSCANYFGKVFLKHIGVSPTQYRKSNNLYEVHRALFKT